jgi:excinuclease UvrABC nuclease subunit
MPSMPLHELHPFGDAEIAKLPPQPGVYVLFQIQIPIRVGAAGNLRRDLSAAKAEFPGATHFSVELLSAENVAQRAQAVTEELRLVRALGFGSQR